MFFHCFRLKISIIGQQHRKHLYQLRSFRGINGGGRNVDNLEKSKNTATINPHDSMMYDKMIRVLRMVATTFAIGLCCQRFLAEPIWLSGPSMEPTIQSNDLIIAEKYTSTFGRHNYKKGDIVVARAPMNPHQLICKRIVALPGENVRSNLFYRQTVPSGHVWLLGDNKHNSTDSREFGALPIGLIMGRVVCRIWPWNRITKFD